MKKIGRIFYKIYKLKFRYPFLISLIGLVLVTGLCFEALGNFYLYKKSANKRMEFNATSFHFFLGNVLKREWMRITSPRVKEKSPLPTFYVTANNRDVQKLNSNLPHSGKSQYINAFMKVNDSLARGVKMRYRGDHSYHWFYPQKSLRLRLAGRDLYNMEKKLNLINPPHDFTMLMESINYPLSREEGLIAPDYYPIRVFFNGEYMGVYTYLSQVDESLLRKHKRMPGSIYSGDSAPPGPGGVSMLWRDEKCWEKIGSRNLEQKNDREDIAFLIHAVNNFDDTRFYRFFNNIMDKEKFYTFFAMDTVFGAAHHDYHHNHKLYFDPYKGKFEPIQWDMAQWSTRTEKDVSYFPLLHRVKLNPILEYERDLVAYRLLEKYPYENSINKLRALHSLTLEDLKADIFKDTANYLDKPFHGWVSTPTSTSEAEKILVSVENVLKKRLALNRKIFSDVTASCHIKTLPGGLQYIVFQIMGNSPVKIKLLSWLRKNARGDLRIFKDTNLNGILDEPDIFITAESDEQLLFPGRKVVKIKTPAPILTGKVKCVNFPLYYSFLVENKIDLNKLSPMEATNAVTREKITVDFESFFMRTGCSSIHPWKIPTYRRRVKTLSGTIQVHNDMAFDKYTVVNILPGTTFLLYPGKSLFFYGQVNAPGQKDKPIRFIAMDKNRPWGSVVLQGKHASGSRFRYCDFSHGSIAQNRLIKYTAQLNIHDLEDFKLVHCTLGPNYVGDDSMHVAYASGVIEDCTFYNAGSDALDVDIAKVSVEKCLFVNSGNDSLDFMTSDVTVKNSIFINAQDKGISTGEWSTALFRNNLFYGCNIGLEVKDKSVVNLEHILIVQSRFKAVNLYNKNNRYDRGGTVNSPQLYIVGGNKDVTADEHSTLNIKQIIQSFPNIRGFKLIAAKLNNMQHWADLEKGVNEILKKYEQ